MLCFEGYPIDALTAFFKELVCLNHELQSKGSVPFRYQLRQKCVVILIWTTVNDFSSTLPWAKIMLSCPEQMINMYF